MLEAIEQSCILAYFGIFFTILFASMLIWKFVNVLRVHLFSLCTSDLKEFGPWAVVTGGSSGIGRGYANELAKRGLHIVIVSNELQALKAAAEEITSQYGVECRYIHVDLSHDNAYKHVFSRLKDTDVGILVNCAGVLGDFPCHILDESDRDVNLMLELHIKAVVHATRLFLPSMLARKRAAIVTVSSIASIIPLPFLSVYSACKAFSDRFTRALYYEYKWKNVSFQSLTPFIIWTRMVEERARGLKHIELYKILTLDRDIFVRNAVRTINLTDHTSGNWFLDIVWYAAFKIVNIFWAYFVVIMAHLFKKSLYKYKRNN
ncbi:hydroxysteroid dehydrogenase-like protein 1 [Centruroides sculpturatus]|uniref:hydroxysteroid dehydrogenase-like protein 1 n=1 Tax=Centruroides sculpturatus TaxID=218467 RepID=UPI000C6E73C8|nr:hydroxysteroid dehydrogenase-like protein 1 [Centruroides sculpturatus]